MKIVSHALAMDRVWKVQPHPIQKRRRRWRVVVVMQPGCWQMGDIFYMHPELIVKLGNGHSITYLKRELTRNGVLC